MATIIPASRTGNGNNNLTERTRGYEGRRSWLSDESRGTASLSKIMTDGRHRWERRRTTFSPHQGLFSAAIVFHIEPTTKTRIVRGCSAAPRGSVIKKNDREMRIRRKRRRKSARIRRRVLCPAGFTAVTAPSSFHNYLGALSRMDGERVGEISMSTEVAGNEYVYDGWDRKGVLEVGITRCVDFLGRVRRLMSISI